MSSALHCARVFLRPNPPTGSVRFLINVPVERAYTCANAERRCPRDNPNEVSSGRLAVISDALGPGEAHTRVPTSSDLPVSPPGRDPQRHSHRPFFECSKFNHTRARGEDCDWQTPPPSPRQVCRQ
ncbi:hypothetical protein C8F04DRAFT_1256980 [Mycena alexandri]|uniref:Uncharacterized protein n=1 Tax=Mycena alexandri TaxID=1745969 RepID=A0AAD6T119_9AGAR|nr:hypothetical protein C8F04DRAFT_1256980 [Mycena alexandri]